MQIPIVSLSIVEAVSEFVATLTLFVTELFPQTANNGGDIPAIIIACFSIMLVLAAWRIVS